MRSPVKAPGPRPKAIASRSRDADSGLAEQRQHRGQEAGRRPRAAFAFVREDAAVRRQRDAHRARWPCRTRAACAALQPRARARAARPRIPARHSRSRAAASRLSMPSTNFSDAAHAIIECMRPRLFASLARRGHGLPGRRGASGHPRRADRSRCRAGARQGAARVRSSRRAGGRRDAPARWPGSPTSPVNPASLMKLVTTSRRTRPARPGLDLDARRCGCRAASPTACCRATSSSRAAAIRSSCSSGCGCCCGACSSSACARSAATSCSTAAPSACRRRAPADFDGEPLRPVQRAAGCAAAELPLGAADVHARSRRAACAPHRRRPAAGRRAGRCERCRSRQRLATTGARALKAEFADAGAAAFRRRASGRLRREDLAGRLRRSGDLQRARPRRGSGPRSAASSAAIVRDGAAPAATPSFELARRRSPSVVRDINKFSNNVMAQQLFLTARR